jgi:sugar lactone lactonase YvrE
MSRWCIYVGLGIAFAASAQAAMGAAPPSGTHVPEVALSARLILDHVYKPARVRAQPGGDLFVLSRSDNSIVRCRYERGEFRIVGRLGRIGNGPGELLNPADFAVAADGVVWVADAGNDRVVALGPQGQQITAFAVKRPMAIAIAGNRIVTVGTYDNSLARVWSLDGKDLGYLGTVPRDAPGDDQVHRAYNSRGYPVSAAGRLYYVFRSLLPPRFHEYDVPSLQLSRETAVTTGELDQLVASVRSATQNDAAAFRYSAVFNGGTVDVSGNLWIATASPIVYRFSPAGRLTRKYSVTVNRRKVGVHDMTFLDRRSLVGISAGLGLWIATVEGS